MRVSGHFSEQVMVSSWVTFNAAYYYGRVLYDAEFLGKIQSAQTFLVMHSGGAGWRDSARLEARVSATRDGAGVADEHSRGAGWRDSGCCRNENI